MSFIKKIILKILSPILNRLTEIENKIAINKGLSKGALGANIRSIDLKNPLSWEFSALSQNGEDGITDVLISYLIKPNKYFIEIGAGNGITSNTAWLALVKNYSGIMIDGGQDSINTAKSIKHGFTIDYQLKFVTLENCLEINKETEHSNPDLFSIDIDGNDYYIMKKLLENNFLPKIVIVEYNSAFGPNDSVTIKYDSKFNFSKAHPSCLYYGVSITGWKKLFKNFGYKFITVDSNGVNAIFVKENEFKQDFINNQFEGVEFRENFYQKNKFNCNWEKQYKIIKNLPLSSIQ